MDIESVPIDSVSTHPQNTRKHDEPNIAAIMRSLDTFGQMTPIVVGLQGYILKGNGTWIAAKRLDWDTIDAILIAGLSPERELAYSIADNKTSDLSEFDYDTLANVLKYLEEGGEDLADTGLQEYEYSELLNMDEDKEDRRESTAHTVKVTVLVEDYKHIRRAVMRATRLSMVDKDAPDVDTLIVLCREFCKPRRKV